MADRSLADLYAIYVYLDGFALRVRRAGKVVSVPVLGVVGVLADGHKHLLALELCGGESFAAWKGCLDDLVARAGCRRRCWRSSTAMPAAARRRARLVQGGGPTVLRAQAAQS